MITLAAAAVVAWPYVQRHTGPDAVHQLQSDSALQRAIGGVSVFQGLADTNLVTWVHAHKLVILA